MMKLELMWRVLDYLAEDATQLIEDILSRWANDAKDSHFFRSSANFVFTFQMSNKPYFLRFNHESERTVEAIKQELAFVNYLDQKGLNVAKPIPSLKGAFVESVSSTLGTFHAVVFEALERKQYDLNELSSEQIVEWGKTLGELHQISSSYPASKRPTWQTQLDWVKSYLPQEEKAALAIASRLEQKLGFLPASCSNYGLIHFDFELDNIVWEGNQIKAIDFDDCCYSWFIADLTFALRDLFDDNPSRVDLKNPSLKSFIQGYRSQQALSDETLALLPLFLSFHNLLLFTKIVRSREKFDKTNAPEWTEQLDEKLENKLASYRENFAQILD